MYKPLSCLCLLATLFIATNSEARIPAPPEGSTARCKDGTYYSGTTKRDACNGHKGVAEWYGQRPNKKKSTSKSN